MDNLYVKRVAPIRRIQMLEVNEKGELVPDYTQPTVSNPLEHVVRRDFDEVIDFIDFCIERDKDIKQELELMFMCYMKQKLKST